MSVIVFSYNVLFLVSLMLYLPGLQDSRLSCHQVSLDFATSGVVFLSAFCPLNLITQGLELLILVMLNEKYYSLQYRLNPYAHWHV